MAEPGNTNSVKQHPSKPAPATTKPARPMPENAAPGSGGLPVTTSVVTETSRGKTATYAMIGLAAFLAWRVLR